MRSICRALKRLAAAYPDVEIICPVHLNPNVRRIFRTELGDVRGIRLLDPLPYDDFIFLMSRAYFVITDSGGIQEEAPSLGKPVLVMREVSERPDGVQMGIAKLVGTSERRIFSEAGRLIRDVRAYRRMVGGENPYGDGKASVRIVRELARVVRS